MRTNLGRILFTTGRLDSHYCDTVRICRDHSAALDPPATTLRKQSRSYPPPIPNWESSFCVPALSPCVSRALSHPSKLLSSPSSTSNYTAKPPQPSIAV